MNNTLSRVCMYVCMWGDESLGWHVMLSRCVTACMRRCRYVCVCVCARARARVYALICEEPPAGLESMTLLPLAASTVAPAPVSGLPAASRDNACTQAQQCVRMTQVTDSVL